MASGMARSHRGSGHRAGPQRQVPRRVWPWRERVHAGDVGRDVDLPSDGPVAPLGRLCVRLRRRGRRWRFRAGWRPSVSTPRARPQRAQRPRRRRGAAGAGGSRRSWGACVVNEGLRHRGADRRAPSSSFKITMRSISSTVTVSAGDLLGVLRSPGAGRRRDVDDDAGETGVREPHGRARRRRPSPPPDPSATTSSRDPAWTS